MAGAPNSDARAGLNVLNHGLAMGTLIVSMTRTRSVRVRVIADEGHKPGSLVEQKISHVSERRRAALQRGGALKPDLLQAQPPAHHCQAHTSNKGQIAANPLRRLTRKIGGVADIPALVVR